MFATPEEINALLNVQQIEYDIMHKTKEFEELPQRETILNCREQRVSITEKISKIQSLLKDNEKKRTHVTDEDTSLEKKEHGVQAAIEAAGTDYRNIESRTKELDGIFRRRKVLSEELATIDEEAAKINQLLSQAQSALSDIDASELAATNIFKEQGSQLKTEIAQAENTKRELLQSVNDELSKAYAEVANRSGSVVIGKLESSRCGVCRAAIDAGRIIELRAQAPVGNCPICKRLLIVE